MEVKNLRREITILKQEVKSLRKIKAKIYALLEQDSDHAYHDRRDPHADCPRCNETGTARSKDWLVLG